MHHLHDGRPAHYSSRSGDHVDRACARAHRRSCQEYLRVCDLHGARQVYPPFLARGRRQADRRGARAHASLMTARQGNLLGFLACACLLAYAYYAQYVMHLEPCPLCIFQRIGIFVLGVMFLIAALHDPAAFGRRVYTGLLSLAALATIGVALRHLYIQSLPPDAVPACGASLDFLLKVFSLNEVLMKVLSGSGECA